MIKIKITFTNGCGDYNIDLSINIINDKSNDFYENVSTADFTPKIKCRPEFEIRQSF